MTDWMEKANAQKDDYLKDLTTLVKIPSVRDDSQATADAPLGPGPAKALHAFLEMAKKDGFRTKNIDNVVGYAEWGEGDETVAILAHLDVMPAGNGWDSDPFDPIIKDGNFIGRGSSDDKGPGLAAYYALKTLKDMGVKFHKKVRFVAGTDEENDWTGMTKYFETEPMPDLGFSPDAEFPVYNGEKGMFSIKLDMAGGNEGDDVLKSFKSGLRFNMVPREADVVVEVEDNQAVMDAYTDFLDNNPVTGEAYEDKDGLHLEMIGKAAHGMEPEKGINAGTYMARFLQQLKLGVNAKNFVDYIANYLHLDDRMKGFDGAFTDDVMGDLTMNAGIMNFDGQKGGHLDMNFRFPKGITPDDILNKVQPVAADFNIDAHYDTFHAPHFVSPDDPMVKTLMKSYIDVTGDKDAKPECIGGRTFGQLIDNGVAFGALMPDTPNTMHQANEYQPVDDLVKSMAIYMQAIHDLVADE